MVQRYIQIAKKMLVKGESDCKNQYLVLLIFEYRNTLISNNLPSPSEILFDRKTNELLIRKEYIHQVSKNLNIRKKLLECQEVQKYYFDKN